MKEQRSAVLAGSDFRTSTLAALSFLLMLLLVGALTVRAVRSEMIGQLQEQILEEVEVFYDIRERGGDAELRRAVAQLADPRLSQHRMVGLFSADGERLEGPIDLAPELVGEGTLAWARQEAGGRYLAMATPVGSEGNVLVIGRSPALIDASIERLIMALFVAGVAVTWVVVGLGYAASRHTYERLMSMADVLGHVSRGEASARLAVSRRNDQIDRIAMAVNERLDRLERLTESTRNAAAGLAHELRSPLNRLTVALQEAAASKDPHAGLLDAAMREARRLDRTFDAVLRIARLEGGMPRNFAPLDAAALVREVHETFEGAVEDGGRRLVLREAFDPVPVLGDEAMLAQALANLIGNAERHTQHGSTVSLGAEARAGDVVILVADDGPGIPPAQREQAVRPFRSLSARSGSGLGLALVRAIAEHHGGRLELSDARPGLCAGIVLPAAPAQRTPNT